MKNILKLMNLEKTVFTTADLMIAWGIENKKVLWVNISRALKKGYLRAVSRGIYHLSQRDVNIFELAGKINKNSYISFETVLAENGVIYQWYGEVMSATWGISKVIKNKYGKFKYYHLPENVILNRLGIINKGNYFMASPERAFCDKVYKNGLGYFDDLSGLDKNKLKEISKIYNNKRLENDIKKICK